MGTGDHSKRSDPREHGDFPVMRLLPPHELDQHSTTTVPVQSILPGDSPRLVDINEEHVQVLAESTETLPPILVHRTSMRVIDGMHRLQAAILNGQSEIDVRFFDGSEDDAFVIAVQENTRHGLPLTLADRKEATVRVIASHPHWSNRMIAKVTGVAPNTAGAIRRRSTEQNEHSNTRIGQDGRVRPSNSEAARRLAAELITENPRLSLRNVAKAAAIAPSTVLDVRARLREGRDPVPSKERSRDDSLTTPGITERRHRSSDTDRASVLQSLTQDPSLRLKEITRTLLRWLNILAGGRSEWYQITNHLPPHCVHMVAELARQNAGAWHQFADMLEQRKQCGDAMGEP